MNSDTLLDFAQFQLSPCKTRCELFVSSGGKTEKIASGFLKPFLTHLRVAEEQAKQSVQWIQLEVEKRENDGGWFNKGTLERFVRFVSTPEILQAVNTFDAEMSQLEGARKIYFQGSENQHSSEQGENESAANAAADSTKKELLRAIDVRLAAVNQDLATAFFWASSAGFSLDAVSQLLLFANKFGAHRLREACTKFISLCHNRPDLITHQRVPPSRQWKGIEDAKIRSSSGSDMSIDEPEVDPTPIVIRPFTTEPSEKPSADPIMEKETNNTSENVPTQYGSRRLSVQDRINLFESKKEQSTSASSNSSNGGGTNKVVVVKGEHKRQPSDASLEKSVLRRWSGASDMSIDVTSNSNSSVSAAPVSHVNSQARPESRTEVFKDTAISLHKLDNKDKLMQSSSSSSKDKTPHSGFSNNGNTVARYDSASESEDNTKVTNQKTPTSNFDKDTQNFSEMKRQETVHTSKFCAPSMENDQVPLVINLKTFVGKTEDETTKSKVPLDSQLESKATSYKAESTRKQNNSQTQLNVDIRNQETQKNKEATVFQNSLEVPTEVGYSSQRKQLNQGTNIPVFSTKKNKDNISTLPSQRAQATSNDLQMKADELEKLFAAHKFRVHEDQTTSEAQKSTLKMQPEVTISDHFSDMNTQSERFSADVEFDPDLLIKLANNLDSTNNMKQKLGEYVASDDSRGKLYTKYMQKRDEKLREEWGSKSAEKKAKLMAMQENLERSEAEMKTKLARSANADLARSRAEKMRSFNIRSSLKTQGQTIDIFHGKGEDLQARPHIEILSGNVSSTSSKKVLYSKSLSSSTARTPAASSIPKPQIKATNSNSIRRRDHLSENPLAQSVPNFSDLRKENTKPTPGLTKITPHAQSRTSEETNLVRDEKSCRHSMTKSLGSSNEVPKEHIEQNGKKTEKLTEAKDSKPFLRKSNGRNPCAGSLKTKPKLSSNMKNPKEQEYSEGLIVHQASSPHIVKEEEDFDYLQPADIPVESDSENDYVTVSESQDLDDSTIEYSKPSQGNIHDSFSYVNETSDIDASVDSPIGSPASWNSHPLNQMMEADAVRMRKKWGNAHIPVLVANATQNARKDATKGFKRFLNFGRKGRGSDYLVNDWVSASTASEGDEDTDDGREMGSRASDELRKSRMGYMNSSGYSFNGSDAFSDQVQPLQSSIPDAPTDFKFRDDPLCGGSMKAPRSFFSLSSFRSKANEAKPR